MYRAYYAIPPTLKTSKGELTDAVYGVGSMLLAMLKIEEPDAMLFCFDAGDQTFRHQEHDAYKEGRAETPDEFYTQIPRIMEMVDTFGIHHVADSRFEADDFLCTYARAAEAAGMRVTIVTGDRDALQLATANIRIAIPHKGYQQAEYLGPKEIEAKYGIRPDQVASYKGLVGDTSDNLAGVLGIGPKTAASLLQMYDTLQGVYEHLGEIKPVIRAKLEKDREQAFFCERMATLICDIPLPVALDALRLSGLDADPPISFFRGIESPGLAKRLEQFLSTPYGRTHFLPRAPQSPVVVSKSGGEDQLTLF